MAINESNAYFALTHLLSKDARDSVIARALDFRRSASAEAEAKFKNAAAKDLKIPGFARRQAMAPKDLLMGALKRNLRYSIDLAAAVLCLWVESHPELHADVLQFLADEDDELGEAFAHDADDRVPTGWSEEIQALTSDFLAENPDYQAEDVTLMISLMSGVAESDLGEGPIQQGSAQAPVGGKDAEVSERDGAVGRKEGMESELFSTLLSNLTDLPATAAEWDEIPALVEALEALAADKLAERNISAALREALSRLHGECADGLTYFELSECELWEAASCPAGEAARAAEQVSQLVSVLLEHEEMQNRPAPTFAQDRQKQERLAALAAEVTSRYGTLKALFGQKPAPDPHGFILSADVPATSDGPEGSEADDKIEEAPAESEADEMGGEAHPDRPLEPASRLSETSVPAEESAESEGTTLEVTPRGSEWGEPKQPVAEWSTNGTSLGVGEQTPQPADSHHDNKAHPDTSELVGADAGDAGPASRRIAALILQNDLPGAYWLARSVESEGAACPAPSWLLGTVQGARWLSEDAYTLIGDLLAVARERQPGDSPVEELLGLAASLKPALIAPGSGLINWVREVKVCPAVNELAAAVGQFTSYGKPLPLEALLEDGGAQQPSDKAEEVAIEARRWLEEALRWRPKNKGATDVWRHLVSPGGAVSELLAPLSEGRDGAADRVRSGIELLSDPGHVSRLIRDIHSDSVGGRKVQPIEGSTRQQILRNVQEACAMARRWCDLVEHGDEPHAKGDWLHKQTVELRETVDAQMGNADSALAELERTHEDALVGAAARCLRDALAGLGGVLRIRTTPAVAFPEGLKHHELYENETRGLLPMLSRRLLLLPEIELGDDSQPVDSDMPKVAEALWDADANSRTLDDAFAGWLQKQDYRFAEAFLGAEDDGTMARRYQEALDGSRAALRATIVHAQDLIEQAVVDGIIDEERSEFSARVAAIDPEKTLNFIPLFSDLERLRADLKEARQLRLNHLIDKWDRLRPALGHRIEAERLARVRTFIDTSVGRGDTRVLDECLARLAEVTDSGAEFEESWFEHPDKREVLAEFLEAAPRIDAWLRQERTALQALPEAITTGRTVGGIKYGGLLRDRRQEALDALKAWRDLKKGGAYTRDSAANLAVLMRFLGFTLGADGPKGVKTDKPGHDWLFARVSGSASDLARPIPQFGSQAQGQYDVLCLWERPGADTIGARLHELRLDSRNLLVFYLGRMTDKQRGEVAALARGRELTILVLDELLLLFLTGENDARLPSLLRCALPFTALNPYTPYQAGYVPPEMFFGRELMAREIQRLTGSCLVYGGRQLGKSALLRHAARQYHYPERGQYAWVDDIKLIGDPQAGKPTESLWVRIRDGFVRHGLLRRPTVERPEEIRRDIREALGDATKRSVIMMFDEADNFLDADAQDGFRLVTALRELMLETERRLKVVFAGLQNVQRFQGIPNQPLAHFGRALLVGPLEPRAAEDLVREPFEALGYRFADDAAVLRILSYTNYHAGLIQLFCQELLKKLQSRPAHASPPYVVSQSDVEAVYRVRQVRESIRERFDWTLALNPRYQAVAWSLIEDQNGSRDSYAEAYHAGQIHKLAAGWWPKGFEGMGADQLQGLLDEMCGLGVLLRDGGGLYRLRSPNLVRLMGTEGDVENRLLELSQRPREIKYDADSHHARLDDAARRYSPLTYAQERLLNQPQFGVGLVFGSEATGLSLLADGVARFVPPNQPQGASAECATIPSSVSDEHAMSKWLLEFVESRQKYERLVVHQELAGSAESLRGRVRAALNFCQSRRRSRKQWLRVIFFLGPDASANWLGLPAAARGELEERADLSTALRRWNLDGVRQRLADHDKIHSDEVSKEILRITGGWPCLLDELFDACNGQNDPRPCAHAMERRLLAPGEETVKSLLGLMGVTALGLSHLVLEHLAREGDLTRDLIAPGYMNGPDDMSQLACDTAVDFLLRMGCVDESDGVVSLDPVVRRLLTH